MSEKIIEPLEIRKVLKDKLQKKDVIFVFPTDIDTNTWADWVVQNPEESGVKTVDLGRFLPWDNFKEQYLSVRKDGYHAIPSILRKFFVYQILEENAQAKKNGAPLFFSTIINPQFAENALFFTDWLSKNLTALDMWHKRFVEKIEQNGIDPDGEDQDYEKLYQRYCDFLENHKMFEQAWCNPDFAENGTGFVLFYPEILEDFLEYEGILKNAQNVQIVKVPSLEDARICGTKYENSRTELRKTALNIRRLVEKGVMWNQIAVHVPNLENVRPYIEREFRNYCIPFVVRAGFPFTVNCAGNIFELLNECKKTDFSYESVRELLLNGYVPWSKANENGQISDWMLELIKVGCERHCLCSYKKTWDDDQVTDSWVETLSTGGNETNLILERYSKLKAAVNRICEAKTFEEVRTGWFAFKNGFLDEERFTESANNILSRSIKYLEELSQIEKDYFEQMGFSVQNPFEFFLNELKGKTYTPQNSSDGVNVFNYRVAACSAYKYNFVLNCSQNDVSVTFKQLDFLNDIKRKTLGMGTVDVSKQFLWLYNKFADEGKQYFTCSENTFDGFAIPHKFLSVEDKVTGENKSTFRDEDDFVKNEKLWFCHGKDSEQAPKTLSHLQVKEFEAWKKKLYSSEESQADYSVCDELQKKVHHKLYEDMNRICAENPKTGPDKIKITQTDLNAFYPCPRKWLFSSVLQMKEDSLETDLMDQFEMGNLYHLIVQKVMESIRDQKISPVLQDESTAGGEKSERQTGSFEKTVLSLIEKSFDEAVVLRHYSKMPLVLDMIKSQKNAIVNILYKMILTVFSTYPDFSPSQLEKEYWAYLQDEDLCLYGKIDCVMSDVDSDVILDYKKSSTKKSGDCWIQEKLAKTGENSYMLGDFQIPLYVKLAQENKLNPSKAAFVSIQKATVASVIPKKRNSSETVQDYEETMNFAIEAAKEFKESVDQSNFEPVVDPKRNAHLFEPMRNCAVCKYKSVCRSIFKVGGNPVKRLKKSE